MGHSANFIEQFTRAGSCAEPHWVEEIGGSGPREFPDWLARKATDESSLCRKMGSGGVGWLEGW